MGNGLYFAQCLPPMNIAALPRLHDVYFNVIASLSLQCSDPSHIQPVALLDGAEDVPWEPFLWDAG